MTSSASGGKYKSSATATGALSGRVARQRLAPRKLHLGSGCRAPAVGIEIARQSAPPLSVASSSPRAIVAVTCVVSSLIPLSCTYDADTASESWWEQRQQCAHIDARALRPAHHSPYSSPRPFHPPPPPWVKSDKRCVARLQAHAPLSRLGFALPKECLHQKLARLTHVQRGSDTIDFVECHEWTS